MIAEAIISLEESEILPEETKRRKGKETDERFLVFGFEGMSKHYLQKNVNSVFFYLIL